jgi:hypothetical protein
MMLPTAKLHSDGMRPSRTGAPAPPKDTYATPRASSYVQTGKSPGVVTTTPLPTLPNTAAPAAVVSSTALRSALEHRRFNPLTPYRAQAWGRLLHAADLTSRYPNLVYMLNNGFQAGIPAIAVSYIPSNNASVGEHCNAFSNIITLEFQKDRYIGPATKNQIESLLGPFQASPLSIIPKPNKPGKYRLIQNFSHPHNPIRGISAINSHIESALYPCTWGTFGTIALTIEKLPPGSEAAVRDVKEAYRTIPLHSSQWPGMIVKLQGEDRYAIDTQNAFGLASGAGIYGRIADAGTDIMRAQGLGPISKWVDDHVFFRIRRPHLEHFNQARCAQALAIQNNGGQLHVKGRLWFKGSIRDNGKIEEFDEDHSAPIRDLAKRSPRSPHDALFTYAMQDIDDISAQLGIPWELEKDAPFASSFTFIGLTWNLATRSVSLPDTKKQKYGEAIKAWNSSRTHTLNEVEKLHGKLLHASLVITQGRPFLVSIEAFLGVFHDTPFKPRSPPRHLQEDLRWWASALTQPNVQRPLHTSVTVADLSAFSDASSEVGIGIVIGERWRAWRLIPGWNRPGSNRDIGWAEAVGFLLLAATVTNQWPGGGHFRLFGDNMGVVEGWWKGQSRNRPTNEVFKMVNQISDNSNAFFYSKYVPTKHNPADDPSRGIYPSHPNSKTSSWTLTTHPSPSNSPWQEREPSPPQSQNLPETQRASTPHTHLTITRSKSWPGPPTNNDIPKFNFPIAKDRPHPLPAPPPYKPSLTPKPSPLRPHVLAKKRISSWAPASRSQPNPLDEEERVRQVLEAGWDESTLATYGTGLLTYQVFCDHKGIMEIDRTPISSDLLSIFIAALAGSYSHSTIANYVAGLRAWHLLNKLEWSPNDEEVKILLRAAQKTSPLSSKKPKRTPFTITIIATIHSFLDLRNPLHIAVYACLTTAFFATARLGEFTVPNLSAFDPSLYPTRANLETISDRANIATTILHLPKTKTAPSGEDVYWTAQEGITDPVAALAAHLILNNPPPDAHIFAYPLNGSFRPLTKRNFLFVINTAAKRAGLGTLQGHGIRIGSTLEYLLRGLSFEAMKTKGRWASEAFTVYITRHAEVLAQHTHLGDIQHPLASQPSASRARRR